MLLYNDCIDAYITQFAIIKAQHLTNSTFVSTVDNAVQLVNNSLSFDGPSMVAKQLLTGRCGAKEFFNSIAKAIDDGNPGFKKRDGKGISLATFFQQSIPPDCESLFKIEKSDKYLDWRKVRAIPSSFTAHRILYFFFKELNFAMSHIYFRTIFGDFARPIFQSHFEEKLKGFRVLPFIDTSFPNNQEYAFVLKDDDSFLYIGQGPPIVYKKLNFPQAQASIVGENLNLNYQHDIVKSNNPYCHTFKFTPDDNDWKKVFNEIVLQYLREHCIFNNNIAENSTTVTASNYSALFKDINSSHTECPMYIQYCALMAMVLTTLHVRINPNDNINGCVRSEGIADDVECHEYFKNKKGANKLTTIKSIVNGSYCAVMYIYILTKYGFIKILPNFKGRF